MASSPPPSSLPTSTDTRTTRRSRAPWRSSSSSPANRAFSASIPPIPFAASRRAGRARRDVIDGSTQPCSARFLEAAHKVTRVNDFIGLSPPLRNFFRFFPSSQKAGFRGAPKHEVRGGPPIGWELGLLCLVQKRVSKVKRLFLMNRNTLGRFRFRQDFVCRGGNRAAE